MTPPFELAVDETTFMGSRSGERLSNTASADAGAPRRVGSFLPARMIPDPVRPELPRQFGPDAFAGMAFKTPVMVPDRPGWIDDRLPMPMPTFPDFSRPTTPRTSRPPVSTIDGPYDPRDEAEVASLLEAERGEPEELPYDADAALSEYLAQEEEEDRRRDQAENDPTEEEEADA